MASSPNVKESTMRPWIKRALFGLFGASVALGGLTACGHRYAHERFSNMSAEEQADFRKRAVERVASRLELNEDQKKRLDALAGKLHEQRVALRGATDPRADVRALIAGDKFDRDKARTLVGDKVAAVNTKSPEVIAAFGDFFDSLSPAQQAKVRGFLERRRHGWWNRG
jgi:Spy/CpxP family protein refolding chaperone